MDRVKALPIALYSRAVVAAVSVVIVAAACSTKEAASADSTGAATAAAQTASNPPVGAMTGKIHLDVTGGANAGSYDVDMKEGGCSYGLAGETAWGNQYSTNTSDPKQLSSLQLIVPDAKAAASGTSQFQMTVQFGPLFGSGGASYDVNTRPDASTKGGSGTVTVQDQGKTGKVTFDAKTPEGVGLKGSIDCQSVLRNG
jgi:hypothetical protein